MRTYIPYIQTYFMSQYSRGDEGDMEVALQSGEQAWDMGAGKSTCASVV